MSDNRNIVLSMPPVVNGNPSILILGSIPGRESLRLQQYYAKRGNRFWPVIASLAGTECPAGYEERKNLLYATGIALWDVLKSANRPGSLDSNITHAVPNDIRAFLSEHTSIARIGLNGKKAESEFLSNFPDLYGRYECISLLSTSPANRRFSDREIIENWKKIL